MIVSFLLNYWSIRSGFSIALSRDDGDFLAVGGPGDYLSRGAIWIAKTTVLSPSTGPTRAPSIPPSPTTRPSRTPTKGPTPSPVSSTTSSPTVSLTQAPTKQV